MKKIFMAIIFAICIAGGAINAPITYATPEDDIKKCTEEINRNPNEAVAYNDRGVAYYELGNYKKAISDFNQAIKLNPNFSSAYYNRGYTHYHVF